MVQNNYFVVFAASGFPYVMLCPSSKTCVLIQGIRKLKICCYGYHNIQEKGSNFATIEKKRKAINETNHIYQQQFCIKLILTLILEMNRSSLM